MEHSPTHYLFLLKVSTISISGIVITSALDCKIMQEFIIRATGKYISLTSLERIFGFQQAKFGPSIYTLDVLALYCHYPNYQAYCQEQDHDEQLRDSL